MTAVPDGNHRWDKAMSYNRSGALTYEELAELVSAAKK